ncbi:aerotaxis receptor [Herbaspirillum sp. Sphag1AN]|uniref:methyl-accepting chemotaxis protein n=1 Tax=unclassified Herbaspirillum TaxID=2624150 RepID=UPI001619817A|nr:MULTISPECIES: methyl-accepting chemotaxis protein [unclassified Herbaspirillum]MBB3212703.1 aerotaxis receptor [Herbaspirillum sp. Sphag1AN]MBB3245900.1 aerotaxis receptor [Herbaspirillum sp. Sphag64]
MRTNLPVTNVEQQFKDGQSIVSKTDLQGNILYINPYFLEISGFSEEEVLGQPQNIVRHPDMPVEAFADMWRTLKAGIPWTGLVKNRCKNGDNYWVQANVTPIRENGKAVGYMSVRTKPSRQQVEQASKVYRLFREGKAQGLAIEQGAVVSTGVVTRLRKLGEMSLSRRISLIMGALILLFTSLAGFCLSALASDASLKVWASGAALLGMFLAAWAWYSLQSSIIEPLRVATDVARSIAGGDLTSKFETTRNDDTGQLLRALQQMTVNLVAIIGDVRNNVDSIQVSTKEIARGNMDLSGRTEAQASSLQQTAASMEQLASTVKQNADNASQARHSASSASGIAVTGGEVVSRVTTTMGEISDSARRIVDIIGIIDGIAFQTNILALNAAVEAARAGEQGRGFAVVATEVRSLAQRSATAAKEIKELIDVSVTKVDNGVKLVTQAGSTMSEVVSSVKLVSNIISEISAASSEQSTGINQVNDAVTQMDQVTQQNAALVEEAAAAAASLAEQSSRLSQAVSIFKLIGDVASVPRAAPVLPGHSNRKRLAV